MALANGGAGKQYEFVVKAYCGSTGSTDQYGLHQRICAVVAAGKSL
ncbi:hypothetical protein PBI_TREYKAY_71 [Mycobacterium phage TreyKay]|uniref:Uncharacterized protein n=1 Tax=Mycobacterium phage Prithvi TaxID=2484215 RepID=A0A3G3M1I5_9CAUD|nr:hypothetical protein I5H05_gp32 [Mycobacterium phage Prithvi]ASZ75140.1 hypothetical protein PBI_TREYKAY_71 [Mycobacterium phage TreyKay]AYR00333.1 hypothetical protein PBI_PRITHVI_71 [Mycobacterium phage Prithvi]